MTDRPIAFVLASTAHGMMIVPRNDMVQVEGGAYGVGGQILHRGSYEQREIDQIKGLLSLRRERFGDGVVMLDCGANIGAVTIDCGRHMIDWGVVHAFEPQERLFYAAAGNIVLNNLRNTRVFLMAVGRSAGEISVPILNYESSGSYGSLELQGDNADLGQEVDDDIRMMVQMIAIDDMFLDLDRVDFIKIDVEGMELDVLTGAAETISKHKPILWVEHVKSDLTELSAVLSELGYRHTKAGMNLLCFPQDADYVRAEGEKPHPDMPRLEAAKMLGEDGKTEAAIDLILNSDMTEADHPLHWVAVFNLGTLWLQLGRLTDAISSYQEIIVNGPEEIQDLAKFSRGFAHLQLGNLRLGFDDFEYRKKGDIPPELGDIPKLTPMHVYPGLLSRLEDGKAVTGKPLAGRTVLVLGEMGFGDNIMFARYLRMLTDQGASVVVAVPPSLEPLFRCLEHVHVHSEHSPKPDLWCHMMSLAHIFSTNIDSVPPPALFDLPVPQLARWKGTVMVTTPDSKRLKVGLCWSGSRKSQYDKHRSVPFKELYPLFETLGVSFYSLQIDIRETDQAAYDKAIIFSMGDWLTDFLDTACAIKSLDLVITVDTSVAHLAGSLGVPTWVMLTNFRTYWAWIKDREDSPWYPSMRAIRQEKDGDWSGVIERIVSDLKEHMCKFNFELKKKS